MKKLIVLMVLLFSFTAITTVSADYTQPKNYYEHTFTTAEETHTISKPTDFSLEKLSQATIYYNDVLVVENGNVIDSNAWTYTHRANEKHFILYDDFFEPVIVLFYSAGDYIDFVEGINVRRSGGAMFKPIAGTYTIGVEVEANKPIRPEIQVTNILGNTFDLQVTNYNPYIVNFIVDIYDEDDNLLIPNAGSAGSMDIQAYDPDLVGPQQNSRIITLNYLDLFEGVTFQYNTTYKLDGYFLGEGYQSEPSDRSDRLTITTAHEVVYDINLIYDVNQGDVSGPTSALPRDPLTFQATPFGAFNFHGWNITVNEETTFVDSGQNPLYYIMPYGDITVEALFKEQSFEPGYRTYLFSINESGKRYTTDNPSFFTEGRLSQAIIYIDGVKIVDKGQLVDDTDWLYYNTNPFYDGAAELETKVVGGFKGIMTFSYADGNIFSRNTKQGDIYLMLSGGPLEFPFDLELLLPEVDPNPAITIDTDVAGTVPNNIAAVLDLINANNVYGYIILFVVMVLMVNIGLMYINATAIIYIFINLLVGVLFSFMGMMPLWAAFIWYGIIMIAFIDTFRTGGVSNE